MSLGDRSVTGRVDKVSDFDTEITVLEDADKLRSASRGAYCVILVDLCAPGSQSGLVAYVSSTQR